MTACKYCHLQGHSIDKCPTIVCRVCKAVGHPGWLCTVTPPTEALSSHGMPRLTSTSTGSKPRSRRGGSGGGGGESGRNKGKIYSFESTGSMTSPTIQIDLPWEDSMGSRPPTEALSLHEVSRLTSPHPTPGAGAGTGSRFQDFKGHFRGRNGNGEGRMKATVVNLGSSSRLIAGGVTPPPIQETINLTYYSRMGEVRWVDLV